MLESPGPGSNGKLTVFDSVLLKASTCVMHVSTVKPGTVAPVQTLSPSQHASSRLESPAGTAGLPAGNAPAQLPSSSIVAATLSRAEVHWRINCVSCEPRILTSVTTQQIASVVDVTFPAAAVGRDVPQTGSVSRSRLGGSLPVMRKV